MFQKFDESNVRFLYSPDSDSKFNKFVRDQRGPGRRLGPSIDQRAARELAALARELAEMLAASGADALITHPYEGGHPDHYATAFVAHAARGLFERARSPQLRRLEFTPYFTNAAR